MTSSVAKHNGCKRARHCDLIAYGNMNCCFAHCAPISNTGWARSHWFQVDLGKLTTLVRIATQGTEYDTGNSIFTASTSEYKLSYSIDGVTWTKYSEKGTANDKVNYYIQHQWIVLFARFDWFLYLGISSTIHLLAVSGEKSGARTPFCRKI